MPFDGTGFRVPGATTNALLAGRTRIEKGWCQNAGRTRYGRCLGVSLSEGEADYDTYASGALLLIQAIKETGFEAGGIPEFNDTPGRTKEEILAVYDRAIELSI